MCVGDLSNAVGSAQIHAGLSKSMWRGRGGPQSRRREVRSLFGITAIMCGFARAGQQKRHFRPGNGTSSGEYSLNVNVNVN